MPPNQEAQFAQGINSALNMIKKLNPKKQNPILKGKIPVPTQASAYLVSMNDKYIQLIQQNSHASKSAKLKHILGISEKKDSKETTRRDTLTRYVTYLDALLDAYARFFENCSNTDKVLQPLLKNLESIINKLGPNGKKYIDSQKGLKSTELWTAKYNDELYKLSWDYRFRTMNDNENQTTINFCDDHAANTPYDTRARTVYTMCRDHATKFKDNLQKALTELYDKFNFADNSMSFIRTDQEITKTHNLLRNELKQFTNDLNEFDKIVSKYPRIFEDLSIKQQTETTKQQLENILKSLKYLSTQFTSSNVVNITTTNHAELNTHTKSLLTNTEDLFDSLTDLKSSLLKGNYLQAADDQSNFIERLNYTNDTLKTFQNFIPGIANNSLSHVKLTSITSNVEIITSKLKSSKQTFNKYLKQLKDTPTNYALSRTKKALKLIDGALKGCSNALGPYATFLSLLVATLGPIIGIKIASAHYAKNR